jgi:general secretion pathway protein D
LFEVVQPLLRRRSALTGTLVLLSSAFLLTACIVTADQSVEADPNDPRAQGITDKIRSLDLQPRQPADAGASGIAQAKSSKPAIYLSDGAAPQGGALAERDDGGGSGYDLNFENAPVATVAKVILGDLLGVGYTIDPRVQGTVSLASGRPVPKSDILFVLENALRLSNVALVYDVLGYRLMPVGEAIGTGQVDVRR